MTDSSESSPIIEQLKALAAGEAERLPEDWLAKARHAASLAPDELWPAWSTGECLAVALILHDDEQLAAMDYTRQQALERLRYDIGQPTVAAAGAVFDALRARL